MDLKKFLKTLNKNELIDLIDCYDTYITDFFDTHDNGCIPVSLYEFYDCEYQEILINRAY